MGHFCHFILTIAVLAAIGLASTPADAKNIGEDPPVRCSSCGCGCGGPSGPGAIYQKMSRRNLGDLLDEDSRRRSAPANAAIPNNLVAWRAPRPEVG
jgi:hypothetical protein